jgi:hypothetical protein
VFIYSIGITFRCDLKSKKERRKVSFAFLFLIFAFDPGIGFTLPLACAAFGLLFPKGQQHQASGIHIFFFLNKELTNACFGEAAAPYSLYIYGFLIYIYIFFFYLKKRIGLNESQDRNCSSASTTSGSKNFFA